MMNAVAVLLVCAYGLAACLAADCRYNFTGPMDVVFVMDRSESVNSGKFNESRNLILDIIERSMRIGPDSDRVGIAVITFDATSEVVLDLITPGVPPVYFCELSGGLMERNVTYHNREASGRGFLGSGRPKWRLINTYSSR